MANPLPLDRYTTVHGPLGFGLGAVAGDNQVLGAAPQRGLPTVPAHVHPLETTAGAPVDTYDVAVTFLDGDHPQTALVVALQAGPTHGADWAGVALYRSGVYVPVSRLASGALVWDAANEGRYALPTTVRLTRSGNAVTPMVDGAAGTAGFLALPTVTLGAAPTHHRILCTGRSGPDPLDAAAFATVTPQP